MSNEYLFDRYKCKVTRLCGKKKQFLPVRKPFPNGYLLLCLYLNRFRNVQV